MSGTSQFALLRQRRFLPFFLTQGLGAFNDNLFKQALITLVTFLTVSMSGQAAFLNTLAAGVFILPFFLFSASSGQLADKYDKARLIRWIKFGEIVIMALAAAAFLLHARHPEASVWLLLGVLFLMGTQSAVFGPVKYGLMPQVLDERELIGGNGLVEMGTSVAILVGMIAGTQLVLVPGAGLAWTAAAVVLVAIAGWLAALRMPALPAVAPQLKINWNPFTSTWATVRQLRGNRTVLLSCLGISWFWFFGSVYIVQLITWTKTVLGAGPTVYTVLLSVFSVGTGVGALLCEWLSRRRVELGLVPFGSIGMSVFGADAYFAFPAATGHVDLDLAAFLALPGAWRLVIDVALMAIFSGLFIVPLFALIQSRTPPALRSQVIAANNILNALFMVVATGFMVLMLDVLGFSIPQLFLATAILNALVAIYIYTLVPEFLLRFLTWILINTLYRVRVQGLEHIPEEGGVLLVCNHVSYVDALVIGGTVPRPTRFVMYYKIFNVPVMRSLFRTARAIPIAGAKEDPALLAAAMDAVSAALQAGEVVCLFPEGRLSADGNMEAFRNGVERILERDPVPVVPMALQGLWGSVFSRWNKAQGRRVVPRRFWSRVGLTIGAARMPQDVTAATLEADVRALRGDWA